LTSEHIGRALHAEVFQEIPSDYEGVRNATLEGKPLPRGSSVGKGISTLAGKLAGVEQEAEKKTSRTGIFSLFQRALS